MEYMIYNGELYHYGLKGMKWGTRRWQYDDGRFNDAGKARYFGQNSSHRPDSVRALQGDPVKRKAPQNTQTSTKSSFDKDKAKRIAKKVAVGTAIVAGTALVAYGGYKVHQAGGFSTVSKNLKAKMRETKLEDLKLKQEFNAEKARIRGEGKNDITRIKMEARTKNALIRDEAKANMKKSLEDAKEQRLLGRIDPDNAINRGVIKRELSKGANPTEIKNKISLLDTQERKLLNDGVVSLKDLEGRRGMSVNEWENRRNNAYDNWLDDLAKGKTDTPKPDLKIPTRDIEANAKSAASIVSGTATKVRNISSNAKTTTKKIVNSVKKVALPKISKDQIEAGTKFLSELNKTVKTASETKQQQKQRDDAIVRMYKAQHPNTKLSDKEILDNYSDMTRE